VESLTSFFAIPDIIVYIYAMVNGVLYRVAPSGIKGRGLFASAPIKEDEYIIEYTGEYIPTSVADTLEGNRYLFQIDTHWTIDGSKEENTARFVNHSCDPNCYAWIEQGRVYYRAARDIEKGEELTIDYGQEYFEDFLAGRCACGAEKHRKVRRKKA
jgi:uncharacterized protein